MSLTEAFDSLKSGPAGLTASEAARRLTEFGPNIGGAGSAVAPIVKLI